MPDYLTFVVYQPAGKKTSVCNVYSVRSNELLGVIKWYGSWRQYAFFPEPGTLWNPDCLVQVCSKIAALMRDWKDNKRKEGSA